MESKEQPTNNQTPFIGPRIKWVLLAMVLVAILVYLFYWFQWRPSNVRSNCQYEVYIAFNKDYDRADANPDLTGDTVNDGFIPRYVHDQIEKDNKDFYIQCLRGKGL